MDADTLDPNELATANINPNTGLATDYLNHFNEVAMLIDMLASMPDVVEEVLEWRPISYEEHFLITGFRAKELAIAAYQAADPGVRESFANACADVEAAISDVQAVIYDDPAALEDPSATSGEIYELISKVGGIINAGDTPAADTAFEAAGDDQAAVDALFD